MKYFIEIGSNHYDTLNDLIKLGGWCGVMVEANKKIFDMIDKLPGCFYENVAISDISGMRDFYFYDNDMHGWGTLDPLHLKKLNFQFDPVCIQVPTITFDQLYNKYKFPHLDLLKIDTESFDDKIIRTIDFAKYDIKQLIFEHSHLSTKHLVEMIYKLESNNYNIDSYDEHNICMKK